MSGNEWKKFSRTASDPTGSISAVMTADQLIQQHPELKSLIESLQQEESFEMKYSKADPIVIEIKSLWEIW